MARSNHVIFRDQMQHGQSQDDGLPKIGLRTSKNFNQLRDKVLNFDNEQRLPNHPHGGQHHFIPILHHDNRLLGSPAHLGFDGTPKQDKHRSPSAQHLAPREAGRSPVPHLTPNAGRKTPMPHGAPKYNPRHHH